MGSLFITIGILASILASVVPGIKVDLYNYVSYKHGVFMTNCRDFECNFKINVLICVGCYTVDQKKNSALYYPCIRRLVMGRGRDIQCLEEREFSEITEKKQEGKARKTTEYQNV